jgi:hypothetical protein
MTGERCSGAKRATPPSFLAQNKGAYLFFEMEMIRPVKGQSFPLKKMRAPKVKTLRARHMAEQQGLWAEGIANHNGRAI